MNTLRSFAAIATIALVSSCSTITFTNQGEPEASFEEYTMMHHTLVFGLVEYSDPVRPTAYCDGDWATVTVEQSLLTGFAGQLDSLVVPIVDVWTPWSVTMTCSR